VIDAPVVLLTNVALEHTEVLGDTVEAIAREKLAVAHAARVVVLPDERFADLVPTGAEIRVGGAREAAAAFLRRELEPLEPPLLAGRLERRGEEVWDGAHNPAGARWLAGRLAGEEPYVLVVSILRDKDADATLAALAQLGDAVVATRSDSPRALPAGELAQIAGRHFRDVEAVDDPADALARARARSRRVLVTGSLSLLATFAAQETRVA
jgi:dihydrofolate synthase/folylpolyglutamate synthase